MRLTRHLRQMGHAEYLRPLAQGTQLPSDDFCDPTAYTSVHFIEYETRQRFALRRGDLYRKTNA